MSWPSGAEAGVSAPEIEGRQDQDASHWPELLLCILLQSRRLSSVPSKLDRDEPALPLTAPLLCRESTATEQRLMNS